MSRDKKITSLLDILSLILEVRIKNLFIILFISVTASRAMSLSAVNIPVDIKQLRKLAMVGDADACIELGNRYYHGRDVPQDLYAAFRWYNEAAYNGNPAAKFNVAICYDQGLGTEENKIQALRWYKKAADAGVLQAKFNMALFYMNGERIPSDAGEIIFEADSAKAISLLKECSESNFAPASRELAKLYLEGNKVKQDKKMGTEYLLKAVEGKDPESLYLLGRSYMEAGNNYDKAVPLLHGAAEHNIVDSFELLGICYETGRGVKQNKKMAFEYYLKAAENGVASAQTRIGDYYAKGNIAGEDILKAKYWFGKAAAQKEPYALFMLGTFADRGICEELDKMKAFKLFMRSAQLGFDKAQYNLAAYYSNGSAINQDSNMAVHWYRKAALQSDPKAQRELGFHYLSGDGAEKNYNFGLNWLNASKESGDPAASTFMKEINIPSR